MQIVEGRVAAAEAEILTARAAAEAAEAAAAAAEAAAAAAEKEVVKMEAAEEVVVKMEAAEEVVKMEAAEEVVKMEAAEAAAKEAVGAVLAHDQGCERCEKRLLWLRRRARHLIEAPCSPSTSDCQHSLDPHGASITTPQSITGSPRPHGGRPQVRCSTCIG
jgi:hypothetical protein